MRKLVLCLLILLLFLPNLSQEKKQPEPFSWLAKIEEAKIMLKNVPVEHSTRLYTQRVRYVVTAKKYSKKLKRSVSKRIPRYITYQDFSWKEIALVIFQPETHELKTLVISKAGKELVNLSEQFIVSFEKRKSLITWNGKNTAFQVIDDKKAYWTVIALKWIGRPSNGIVNETIYVPYSTGLHQKELVIAGKNYLSQKLEAAQKDLDTKDVRSVNFPALKITQVIPSVFPKNLGVIEHTDPTEFYAFEDNELHYNPFHRVYIRLGANKEQEFATTKSRAGASGLMQFMLGTYAIVDKKYPRAQLPDYIIGASNHIESIKASYLLLDSDLSKLIEAFGPVIYTDPELEHFLGAAYNGGVGRVILALKINRKNWRNYLRSETKIYLEKLDYLKTHPDV